MEQNQTKSRRWKNPLMTCGIGCGASLLIAIVAGVGFYFWAVSPGTQIPTQRVIGPESLAYLKVNQLSRDEGFRSLAADVLLEMQEDQFRRSAQRVPQPLAWLQWTQRSSPQQVMKSLDRDFPRDITVTVESSPDVGGVGIAAAVNLARYPRLLRWFVAWFAEDLVREMQKEFPGAGLEFVENTAIWGQSPEILSLVLDRARGLRSAAGASTEMLDMLESGSERWDIHASAENREGLMLEIADRLRELPEDFPLRLPSGAAELIPTASRLRMGLDVVSRDLITLQIIADASPAEAAAKWEAMLGELVTLNRPSPENPLQISSEVLRRGSEVILDVEITHLKEALLQLLKSAQDSSESERKRPEKTP